MADFLDYFFQFPDRGSALRDPIVGPLITAGGTNEAILWQGNINSVNSLPGYCVMVSRVGALVPALANHPNILLVNDRTLQLQGAISVLKSAIATLGLIIIINAFSPYTVNGLLQPAPIPPPVVNTYITETGDPYVTEDGLSFYIPES